MLNIAPIVPKTRKVVPPTSEIQREMILIIVKFDAYLIKDNVEQDRYYIGFCSSATEICRFIIIPSPVGAILIIIGFIFHRREF